MQIIKLNIINPQTEIIQTTADILARGGCVVYPTDTVYGLAVNALRPDSVERLFKIKRRPENKAVPVMVKDIEMARKLAYFDKKTEKVLESIWPSAVMVVLPKRGWLSDVLTGGKATIGLRIPDYGFISILMENIDFPITATSANISGQNPSGNIREIISQFRESPKPDLVLDAGNLPKSEPSTVLDLTLPKPKITRIGPVNKNQLLEMLKV